MSAIRVANYMAKEKAKEFLPQALISIAIILYILNIGTNMIWFEIFSLLFVIFYCIYGVSIKSVKETPVSLDFQHGTFNVNKYFSNLVILCMLFIESVFFIVFLSNNHEWIEETKKKPYQFRNLIDFIRIIFLSQVLMTQVELDSNQYPVVALNILLFVFWITTFVILWHMIVTQTIY